MNRAEREDLLADGTLTVAGACQWTGLGKTKLYDMMEAGELPYVRIGRRRLIPRRALMAIAAERLVIRDGWGQTG